MKRFAAIIALALLVTFGSDAFAAQTSPFERFQSFKQITNSAVQSVRTIEAYPMEARYVLVFGEELSKSERTSLSSELATVPSLARQTWPTSRRLNVEFDSPMVRVGVLRWKNGKQTVVMGRMRDHGFLLRFFAGPAVCKELLPESSERVTAVWSSMCDGETPPLSAFRDTGLEAVEEEIFELIRLQVRDAWHPAPDRVERYIDRFQTDGARAVGHLSLAVLHLARLEEEEALRQLEHFESVAAERSKSVVAAQQTFAREMGAAALERLVARQLAQDGFVVLETWERFESWRADDFSVETLQAIARRFRKADRPDEAIAIYHSLIGAPGTDEVSLLTELAQTFVEADDTFRAAATVSYLQERYPDRRLPADVRELLSTPIKVR